MLRRTTGGYCHRVRNTPGLNAGGVFFGRSKGGLLVCSAVLSSDFDVFSKWMREDTACIQNAQTRIFPAYPHLTALLIPVFQFLLADLPAGTGERHIILKINIMKSKSYKNSSEEKNNLWDAFVDYLENTYFPGASELLDTKTIAFEYEAFKSCYA